jgi:AcrR family transcriptional regulator
MMGKATTEEAAITRQKIIDTALAMTIEIGFEKTSLRAIAKAIPMSSSGINAHFPRKADIAKEIEPYLAQMLLDPLKFDSCDSFYDSWVSSLTNHKEFRAAVIALGPIVPTGKGMRKLMGLIECDDYEEARSTVYKAIGYSMEFFSD